MYKDEEIKNNYQSVFNFLKRAAPTASWVQLWVYFVLFSFTLPTFTIKGGPKAHSSHANLNFPSFGHVWI